MALPGAALWATGCGKATREGPGVATGSTASAPSSVLPVASIQRSYEARWTREGAGATVRRLFPGPALRNLDPFVLLDDFDVRRPAGFPMHPHRGFEAYTYMIEGAFFREDNFGNESEIFAGGTQRFTSGSGAWHSEMPSTNGRNRGLQLWVNLPRRLKPMPPDYEGIAAKDMPVTRNGGVATHAIVGETSPVVMQTDMGYEEHIFPNKGAYEATVPEGHNGLVYIVEGAARVAGVEAAAGMVLLPSSGRVPITGIAGTRVAVLHGRPHREGIVHRGPYVD